MTRLLASVALAALLPFAQPAIAQSTTAGATAATVTTQLPRSVVPTNYDVTITPDARALDPADKTPTFAGKVAISVTVREAVSAITLHAADLSFSSATLAKAGGGAVGTGKATVDGASQTASFAFGKTIAPGNYVLTLDYTGKIYSQAAGLFYLDYPAADGSSKRALYTQFENSDARKFVPSWDEPFYKATFTLKAVVPADAMPVSNMPIASRTPAGAGRTLVTFGQSPKMSTYLLFFGVGDFDRATKQAAATEIGVITKKGDVAKAQYALDAAAQILPWYNEYFDTAYPLPKLDHIAAPGRSQFFSAMENWGAIFYFENAMLYDPAISTESDKQRIFSVFAHEMAHQWFGDLVTMSWWDDLWLNEGFASWMQGRASEHFHPEWNPELDAIGGRNAAMSQDALVTTHPVIQHVPTVEAAAQAFDAITYQKGEAVIRMLEAYTGSEGWRSGVRAYMKKYNHSNTVTDDLWREIEAASGKPIVQIAHDFTLKKGVPLISVIGSCQNGATTLSLTQGEFTKDRPGKQPESWNVPVIASAGGATASTLVQGGRGTLTVQGCGPVVVNAGQSGYYRTLYAPAMFTQIAGGFANMKPIDQLGILSDAAALGLAGLQPVTDVLDLANAIPANAAPQVIQSSAGLFTSLYYYSEGNDARQARLRKLAIAKYGPVLQKLGWAPVAGESDNVAILRNTMIQLLGAVGDPATIAEANRRFQAARTDPNAIPASLRRSIVGVVALNANEATWEQIHALAKAETSALVRTQLYTFLGAVDNRALATRALDLALTAEPGETTSPGMIGAVGYNYPDVAFDYVMSHEAAVMTKVDSTSATRFVPRLAAGSYDPAMITKLEAYKAKLPPEAVRPTDEAIAAVKYRIQVRNERMPAVDAWLTKNGY